MFNPKKESRKCCENGCETNNNNVKTKQEFVKRRCDDPDLSLSTLICSVERDIELLEQLEMNSGAHRGSLPLPVSAQLLALPGYRPRGNTGTGATRSRTNAGTGVLGINHVKCIHAEQKG